jgi:acetate kinase
VKQSLASINVGSSSIKFALYEHPGLLLLLHGQIEFIGQSNSRLLFQKGSSAPQTLSSIPTSNHQEAATFLLDWLASQEEFQLLRAIGHRLVHGGKYDKPQRIDRSLLQELHALEHYAPNHLPEELALIETFVERYPKLDQVACFDTSFHHAMPRVATLLPLPRHYMSMGLKRYGFHGLSYEYLIEELCLRAGPQAAQGKVILAHLGNGASMSALYQGKSRDTTMGFTPASGLVMGSRTGDLDPGIMDFLAHKEHITTSEFAHMVHHESGLLGISETSANMSELLAIETTDIRAAEAIELFCYQAKKWIGAYAALLGGLETVVFSGGIGENVPVIRKRICEGLQ